MDNKNLSDIKEEVYKCSKCALCKSVCPVYIATQNEMYLPRGRFIILNNFFNNNKKLSKKFIKDLDKCLNCNLCKNFCPSNIDSVKIFTKIKNEYKYKYSVVHFSFVFKLKMFLYGIKNIFAKRINPNSLKGYREEKIIYFEGCINKYVDSDDANAVMKLLEKMGYKNIQINKQCCGLPYLSDGELEKFRINSLKIISSIPSDAKYILCSCDSCYETLKEVLNGNINIDKLITIDKLLKINNYVLPQSKEPVYYHKTLMREEEVYLPENVKEINKKGCSTLMENFLILKNKEFAQSIKEKTKYSDKETEGKKIITTCPHSKIGLEKEKYKSEILSYAEYIVKEDK